MAISKFIHFLFLVFPVISLASEADLDSHRYFMREARDLQFMPMTLRMDGKQFDFEDAKKYCSKTTSGSNLVSIRLTMVHGKIMKSKEADSIGTDPFCNMKIKMSCAELQRLALTKSEFTVKGKTLYSYRAESGWDSWRTKRGFPLVGGRVMFTSGLSCEKSGWATQMSTQVLLDEGKQGRELADQDEQNAMAAKPHFDTYLACARTFDDEGRRQLCNNNKTTRGETGSRLTIGDVQESLGAHVKIGNFRSVTPVSTTANAESQGNP